MSGKKQEIRIIYPFAPDSVNLNQDGNLLKLIAMIAMLCDHAGKMLFPQYAVMRIVGRIAFPIYAYSLASGCVYTKNHLRYLKRIVLLALISQPLYAVALAHTVPAMFSVSFAENPIKAIWTFYINSWNKPSILVTLAVGLMILWSIRNRELVLTAGLLIFSYLIQNKLDYGFKGIILILLFYLLCSKWWLSLPCVLAFMIWWGLKGSGYSLFGVSFGTQMFAVCALPLIYIHTKSGVKLPKWMFYAFYPAHLILIYCLDKFVM